MLLLRNNKYQKQRLLAWTYTALNQSLVKNKKVKILVIGDSVANQLFKVGQKGNCSEIHSLTCTGAIDIVGQYILMYNFLKNNEPDAVVIINTKYTYNLNAPSVFHYFLKTFYTDENKQHLTESAMNRIRKIPYYYLSQFPHYKTSTWGPQIPREPDTTGVCISDLSAEYLKKMDSLANTKNIHFFALPPPIRISRKKRILQNLHKEINEKDLQSIFKEYDENLVFSKNIEFGDKVHLNQNYVLEYTKAYRAKIRKYMEE